jgi:tRNA uridine 5-carboxymethylaminomethyl modification enzyme
MWSPRAQSDREAFIRQWKRTIENTENLDLWQDTVCELIVKDKTVCGVKTSLGVTFHAKCVILTNGTFLNGLLHIGKIQIAGGRISEPASYGLTEQIKELGFTTDRMKTGTPVRIDGRSVDFSKMSKQDGDNDFHKFSFLDFKPRPLQQRSCWITYTNTTTHNILRDGLVDSPLYNGQIKSIGPRYCPSIETKIVTFAEKEKHQLFLEPEGENSQEYYLNGFSSSLPMDIQYNALRTIEGFENAKIYRPGYAIEYDFFDPTQLTHTLETKYIKNLFFAGQINGTTGYEEAGGQGLIAGINAHINCHGGKEFILARDEAYIGVLIDDLVTKGVDEPYRMFTSRAEYRILLRQDDADMRLTEKAYNIGFAQQDRLNLLTEKKEKRNELIEYIRNKSVKIPEANSMLESIGSSPVKHGCKMIDLLLRPEININLLINHFGELKEKIDLIDNRKEEIIEATEIQLKYEGYIAREQLIANKLKRLENIKIKGKINYDEVHSLSTEARQKLKKIDPETIGQASRISGISPSDINILLIMIGR